MRWFLLVSLKDFHPEVYENSNSYFKYCLIDSDLGSFSDQGKRSSIGNLLIFSKTYSRYLSTINELAVFA